MPELVEAFGLASSTLNRQTTALLKNGLVERTVDPSGSLVHRFRITEERLSRLKKERDHIERMTGRPWPRTGRATHRASRPTGRRRPGAA
ncbi:hypothetical protein [Streptomyces sp. NPDC051677]|uniref:hypothetical protein n=1 Tax=Streptomyces sp. NPDC051677 TaxID=3365669 RepID=UPI0037CE0145